MHTPPFIQPSAYVVALDPEQRITAVSRNVSEVTGGDAGALVGEPGSRVFSAATLQRFRAVNERTTPLPVPLRDGEPVPWGNRQCILHRHSGGTVVEVEARSSESHSLTTEVGLRDVNDAILSSTGTHEMLQTVCEKLAYHLLLDRVVVYELEPEGGGLISVEYNNGVFDKMLGLHFRQVDFSEEAKTAYALESVLVASVTEAPPVDMVGEVESIATIVDQRLGCRPPFPVLDRFMRESGMATNASVALYNQDKLWGVIFGHAREPIHLDYQLRTFLHLVGNLSSQAFSYRLFNQNHRKAIASDYIRARLRENIATASSLVEGLHHSDPSLLDVVPNTTGSAILLEGQLVTIGTTPTESEITSILNWAHEFVKNGEVYHTHCLETNYPPAQQLRETAAGLLLVPLNASCTEWIAWFRPERIEEVLFGSLGTEDRATSQQTFRPTAEVRRCCSLSWAPTEVAAAQDLQLYIRDVVMEKYSQLSRVNHQLQLAYDEMQSFSYTVSHDLRAPLRGIDGFAEIFMEDYGTQIDGQGKALIQTIQQNAARMNQYIADILELSRVGRTTIHAADCDVSSLVNVAMSEIAERPGGEGQGEVEVVIEPDLPHIVGDPQQLGLVFRQLLSNAVKYSSKNVNPRVRVGYRRHAVAGPGEFFVADNGIGIPPLHRERVFGMFNRLVTQKEYDGNGVGLAIVHRIINRHGGEIRIESELGQGATFLFYTNPQV